MSHKKILIAGCLLLLILLSLAMIFTGRNWGLSATADTPRGGKWVASFLIKGKNDYEHNYLINFDVSEDGETIEQILLAHYWGEWTDDTEATGILSPNEIPIKKSSFEYSFSEWSGYTSISYKGKVIFTSATEAQGTTDIDGTEYRWTAAPSADNAADSPTAPAKAVHSAGESPLVAFASNFYQFAYMMSFVLFVGIVVMIIKHFGFDTTSQQGNTTVTTIGGGLLGAIFLGGLALWPLLFFQDEQNALVFAWAFYILLAIKIGFSAWAICLAPGIIRDIGKIPVCLFVPICLIVTSWSARSVELMICLCADTRNILLKLVAIVIGILYTVVYFILDFGALIAFLSMSDRIDKISGAISMAFSERALASKNIEKRAQTLEKLDKINNEWAMRLLVRQSATDPDANLRNTAQKMAENKNLPPELRAELEAAAAAEPVTAPRQTAVESTPFAPPQETTSAHTPPTPPQQTTAYSSYSEPPRALFCKSCGQPLEGNPNFCAHCGSRRAPSPGDPPRQPRMPTAPHRQPAYGGNAAQAGEVGLHGFAKGWVIFVLVCAALSTLSGLPHLAYPGTPGFGLALLYELLCGGRITGLVFLLQKKAYGFWILLGSSALISLMNGLSTGIGSVLASGGLIGVLLTWLFTYKQIDYRFWEKRQSAAPLSGIPQADWNMQRHETIAPQYPPPRQAAEPQSFSGEQNAGQPIACSNTPSRAECRGGLGEPYCSQACYEQSGEYISSVLLQNQEGVCGFCQKPVRASMYGLSECAAIPFEGVTLFICTDCMDQVDLHVRNHPKCCMCQKEIVPDTAPR